MNLGARTSAFPLDPANAWRPDLEALEAAVTLDTRLIAVRFCIRAMQVCTSTSGFLKTPRSFA